MMGNGKRWLAVLLAAAMSVSSMAPVSLAEEVKTETATEKEPEKAEAKKAESAQAEAAKTDAVKLEEKAEDAAQKETAKATDAEKSAAKSETTESQKETAQTDKTNAEDTKADAAAAEATAAAEGTKETASENAEKEQGAEVGKETDAASTDQESAADSKEEENTAASDVAASEEGKETAAEQESQTAAEPEAEAAQSEAEEVPEAEEAGETETEKADEKKASVATAISYDGDEVKFVKVNGTDEFGMFSRQDGSKDELSGDQIQISIIPSNKTVYAGFYYGDITDPDTWKDYVKLQDDGSIVLTVSTDMCGKAYPVVPVKKKDPTATTSAQYYLGIPALEKLKKDEPDTQLQPIAYTGDEVKFVKEDGEAEFGMFSRQDGSKDELSGDQIQISIIPSNKTVYAGFYYGDITDPDTWKDYVKLQDDGSIVLTVSTDMCGKAYPVAPVKKKDPTATTSAQYYLGIPALEKYKQEETEETETPRDEAQPIAYSQTGVAFVDVDGSPFKMYAAADGTKAVLSGNQVKITFVPSKKETYGGFYYGDIRYEDTWKEYTAAKEDGTYEFTVSKELCGKAWPVAVVKKADQTATTSKQYYLGIPAEENLETEALEEKSYAGTVTSSGTEMYASLPGVPAYVAQQEDGTYAVRITTKNSNPDMAAIGTKEAVESHQVDWYKNEGDEDHSAFVVPAEGLKGTVTLYFHSKTSGNWSKSQTTYTFDASDKVISDVEVKLGPNVDPAVKKDDQKESETPASETEKPSSETEKTEETVTTPLRVEKDDGTEYGMVRVSSYTAVSDGKNITIQFYTKDHDSYAMKMYLGTTSEIPQIKEAYERASDKSFTFTVPYSAKGTKIPVVFATAKGWKDTQYYLQIPDVVTETKEPVKEAETTKNTDNTSYKPNSSTSNNGTTSAVNNSTALTDGTYSPDSFSFSGGTGKLNISCTKITIRGGKAYATLVFSSGKIPYVKAGGGRYTPVSQTGSSSTYEVPVALNANNRIIACTTAMSQPHEVAYNLYIGLEAAKNASEQKKEGEETKAEDGNTLVYHKDAPSVPGPAYLGTLKTEGAEFFRIHYYEDGFKVLQVSLAETTPDWNSASDAAANEDKSETEETTAADTVNAQSAAVTAQADDGEIVDAATEEETSLYAQEVLNYLLAPEGSELPAGIDKEMIVVTVPVENSYVDSSAAIQVLAEKKLLDQVAAGNETTQMTEGANEIADAGHIDALDYRALLLGGIDLAVVSFDDVIAASLDEDAEAAAPKTAQEEILEKVSAFGDDLTMLGIPMLVERSADEKTDKGSAEWALVYEALYQAKTATQTEKAA